MDERPKILIVDDTMENIQVLGGILEQANYDVLIATNGKKALETAKASHPDLVLLDILMPDMDGFEVCRRLKSDIGMKAIPVIFISALGMTEQKVFAFRHGAEDYITKPFQLEEVLARVNTHLELKLHRDHLQKLVELRTRELTLAKEATIASMAIMAECRDPETGAHIQRCKSYVRILAENMALQSQDTILSPDEIDLLCQSVPLHDIGKVGIPDAILNKPGILTEEEFSEMKKHTLYGSKAIMETEKVLGSSSFLKYARELTEYHHEKWDGSGYPHGLKGTEIPLSARLMALADVYDALTSKRPYKDAFSTNEAFRIITEGDGRTQPEHFDPVLLSIFRRIRDKFEHISKMFSN